MTHPQHQERRIVIVMAVLVAIALCAMPALAQTGSIVHLTYGSHGTEWHNFLKTMAERFEAETGIHVEVEVGSGGSAYRENVTVRTVGGVAPDVMDFNPGQAATLVAQRVFADLTPFVEASGMDLSQYPPVGIQGMTTEDGYMWGFPMSLLPIPVYFNVDMFAEAGLANPNELGENWNWETYLESARRLTITDLEGNPIQSGTIDPRYRWEQPIHQAGGMVFDRYIFPTESKFNTDPVLRAIEFRNTMYQEGLIARSGGVWNGNVALTNIDGPTIINKWKGNFRMDVALQPAGPSGQRSSEVNPDGFQIHADSKNKELAWKWIEYLVTDADRQFEFAEMTGRLPSLREAMIRYGELDRAMPANWYVLIETAFSPDAFPPYMISDEGIIKALNDGLSPVWKVEVAPEIGLVQLHDQLTALLKSVQ